MVRRLQRIAGIVAVLVLVVTSALVVRSPAVRAPAVVVADHTFSVSGEAGQYGWRLDSGRTPISAGLVRQSSIKSESTDLMEVTVPSTLATGMSVKIDDVIVDLRSPRTVRRLAEETQLRQSLLAERDLLRAGGRPDAIASAERNLSVTEARCAESRAAARRLSALAGSGAVSDADLHAARLLEATCKEEVALARAQTLEARSPPRPEELAGVDARIAAVDARIAELEVLLHNQQIRCPISGVAEVGGYASRTTSSSGTSGSTRYSPDGDMLVRVYDLDPVFVRVAVAERDHSELTAGSPATFYAQALDASFEGHVAEVASSMAIGPDGRPVWFVTVEVPNPDLRLRAGMSGVVDFPDPEGMPQFVTIAAAKLGL